MGSDVVCTYWIQPRCSHLSSVGRIAWARELQMVMWIHWNVRGSRPCLGLHASPEPPPPAPQAWHGHSRPGCSSGSHPSQPELAQAGTGQPGGTKIALAKASAGTCSRWGLGRVSHQARRSLCVFLGALSVPGDFLAHFHPCSETG